MEYKFPFPIYYYEGLVDLLGEYNDLFETITYKELDFGEDRDFEKLYPGEYDNWIAKRNPQKIYVILHHDLDAGALGLKEMTDLERKNGLRSVLSVQVDAVNGTVLSQQGKVEKFPFPEDDALLIELEKEGFEIMYHGNALEKAVYDFELAENIFWEDLATLREKFEIVSYNPHGGAQGPNGEHNKDIVVRKAFESGDLKWVGSRYGVWFTDGLSDGGHYGIKTPEDFDFRDLFCRMIKGKRYRVHIHPLYYGTEVTPSPVFNGTKWYDDMLKVYEGGSNRSFWDPVRKHLDETFG